MCTASLRYSGEAGWFDIAVRYFDQNNGSASYRVLVGDQWIEGWVADYVVPTAGINAHSATRKLVRGVALRPGDVIRIEGTPDGGERAALDFIEIRTAAAAPTR